MYCFVSCFVFTDLPPVGPMDLPLSLLELGCSGRFELITHPLPEHQLPPLSTVCEECVHLCILYRYQELRIALTTACSKMPVGKFPMIYMRCCINAAIIGLQEVIKCCLSHDLIHFSFSCHLTSLVSTLY